jgi:hypothetical protein
VAGKEFFTSRVAFNQQERGVKAMPASEMARSFIENIAKDNREFYTSERGQGALRDLQQSFPHSWIYVAELLQNAVDENATMIRFEEPSPGILVLEHDGDPFDEKDVKGICTKGVSSKGAGTVGFMGVGFKSVFMRFESVAISSGPWKFKLKAEIQVGDEFKDRQRNWIGAVQPQWDDKLKEPSQGMTCRFEFSGRIDGSRDISKDFEAIFKQDKSLIALLATRNVKEIRLFGTTWLTDVSEQKQDADVTRYKIDAYENNSDFMRQWMLFRKGYKPSRNAVRRFLEHRAINPAPEEKEDVYRQAARERFVEIFFQLNEGRHPYLPQKGHAFALLPTMQHVPLGVHVNADWLLTVTRNEFMDVGSSNGPDDNEWQKEIKDNIPILIKAYFEWLVSTDGPAGKTRSSAYDIFPDSKDSEYSLGNWMLDDSFVERLRSLIQDLVFLPLLVDADHPLLFISPNNGALLPGPLRNAFEHRPEFNPKMLFGDTIVSGKSLGNRALNFLLKIKALRTCESADIATYWGQTKVKEWHSGFEPEKGNEALYTLLKALSELDYTTWPTGNLVCLPSEGEQWISRKSATRFPGDWNILVNEPRLPEMLLPFMGDLNTVLQRQFDSFATSRDRFFWTDRIPLKQQDLESMIDSWWKSLPEEDLKGQQIDDVVIFTCWVFQKQATRRNFVQRLLGKHNEGKISLLPWESTLLEEPYAGRFRKTFYQDIPSVVGNYYQYMKRDDWKTFFEKDNISPKGKFKFEIILSSLQKVAVQQILNKPAPIRRKSYINSRWEKFPEINVDNNTYLMVQFSLPEKILDEKCRETKYYRDFARWMEENASPLREHRNPVLLYIPLHQSYVHAEIIEQSASWIKQLNSHAWILAKDGTGPYKPSQVLKDIDLLRPDAPVADLSDDLISILEDAGIFFEAGVPKAGPLKNLQTEGPTCGMERLVELIRDAIEDSENDKSKLQDFMNLLQEIPVLPVPPDQFLVDDSKRVTVKRLVMNAGKGFRSDLKWVVSITSFDNESIEMEIFELLQENFDIPARTNSEQCMDFLEWVWGNKPDADKVRDYLPFAYAYIFDDVNQNNSIRCRWNSIKDNATVFTAGRTWVLVKNGMYYDDINTASLSKSFLPKTSIAAPSHLGSQIQETDIPKGVSLLEIPMLSSRYKIECVHGNNLNVPDKWKERFFNINQLLQNVKCFIENLIINKEEHKSANKKSLSCLNLKKTSNLAQVVTDKRTGDIVERYELSAKNYDNNVFVCEDPADFAAELCHILLKYHMQSVNYDEKLVADLTVLLVLLNSDDFDSHINKIGNNYDFILYDPPKSINEDPVDSEYQPDPIYKDAKNETRTKVNTGSTIYASTGSYTPKDRERKIDGLHKHLEELKVTGLVNNPDIKNQNFQNDDEMIRNSGDEKYRDAVVAYENEQGRHPECKPSLQPGYDIDSFSAPEGSPGRTLVRRIEVKGRRHPWVESEIVELQRKQFELAFHAVCDEEAVCDPDFDYWVYVVEALEDGRFKVLPLRNPARLSNKFELRGGTWRSFAELDDIVDVHAMPIKQKLMHRDRRSILSIPDASII